MKQRGSERQDRNVQRSPARGDPAAHECERCGRAPRHRGIPGRHRADVGKLVDRDDAGFEHFVREHQEDRFPQRSAVKDRDPGSCQQHGERDDLAVMGHRRSDSSSACEIDAEQHDLERNGFEVRIEAGDAGHARHDPLLDPGIAQRAAGKRRVLRRNRRAVEQPLHRRAVHEPVPADEVELDRSPGNSGQNQHHGAAHQPRCGAGPPHDDDEGGKQRGERDREQVRRGPSCEAGKE